MLGGPRVLREASVPRGPAAPAAWVEALLDRVPSSGPRPSEVSRRPLLLVRLLRDSPFSSDSMFLSVVSFFRITFPQIKSPN